MQHTAPVKALRLAERAQFVKDHPGWTFRDYDEANAGDILFMREFEKMLREAERKALEEAKAKQEAKANGK
jgi:hypothetical protein